MDLLFPNVINHGNKLVREPDLDICYLQNNTQSVT